MQLKKNRKNSIYLENHGKIVASKKEKSKVQNILYSSFCVKEGN